MNNAKRQNKRKPKSSGTPPMDLDGDTAAILKKLAPQPVAINQKEGETPQDTLARAFSDPRFTSAYTSQSWGKLQGETLDLQGLVKALAEQIKQVNRGDLSGQEAMLTGQAKTLDLMFNTLARWGFNNLADNLPAAETLLKLALKAQSQSRCSIEALADMKNPRPVAFVKQANIAHGHQQVNNAPATSGDLQPRAGENDIGRNKLLETTRGEWLDTGTKGAASGADKDVAAVGEINRAADP